jgi:HD superfamily phosphohydrolase YqeK
MAIELATHYQLDPNIAAQAGLMHDLAKYFKPQRLLELARAEGLPIDEVDIAAPHLLHLGEARDESAKLYHLFSRYARSWTW